VMMSPVPMRVAIIPPDQDRRSAIHHGRRGDHDGRTCHDHGCRINDRWRRGHDDHWSGVDRSPKTNGDPHLGLCRERKDKGCEADNGDNSQCSEKRFHVWHWLYPLGVVDHARLFLSLLYTHQRYVGVRTVTPCLCAWAHQAPVLLSIVLGGRQTLPGRQEGHQENVRSKPSIRGLEMQEMHHLKVYEGAHVNDEIFFQPLAGGALGMTRTVRGGDGERLFPPMAGHAGVYFPQAQMSLASQVRRADPSAPSCFAHQSMHCKVVSARNASVVRKTAGTLPRLAPG